MKNRPKLTRHTPSEKFKNFYWLKKELLIFCKQEGLSTIGAKNELTTRIEIYLNTGKKTAPSPKFSHVSYDSDKTLTLTTPVKYYKNDAITRDFFVKYLGKKFHFNAYLRQFSDPQFAAKAKITYGELLEGWRQAEDLKKSRGAENPIGSQFEYNRFIREFFLREKDKSLADAIKAWHKLKANPRH